MTNGDKSIKSSSSHVRPSKRRTAVTARQQQIVVCSSEESTKLSSSTSSPQGQQEATVEKIVKSWTTPPLSVNSRVSPAPAEQCKPKSGILVEDDGSAKEQEASCSTSTSNTLPAKAIEKKPEGILRVPKYSSSPKQKKKQDDSNSKVTTNGNVTLAATTPRKNEVVAAVQEFVVERPRRRRAKKQGTTSTTSSLKQQGKAAADDDDSRAVEGYTPQTTTKGTAPPQTKTTTLRQSCAIEHETKSDNDDEPLVFNSLADLMATAGTLQNNPNEPPTMVEAELNFSCMDPDEFEQQKNKSDNNEPTHDDDDDDDESSNHGNDNNNDDDDDELWDVLGLGGDCTDDDGSTVGEPRAPPRAFLQIMAALSQWVTPEAVAYVESHHHHHNKSHNNAPDTTTTIRARTKKNNDVEASRCAGLLALTRMHTPTVYNELLLVHCNRELLLPRTAEQCLADLLQCFDYSRPVTSFETTSALTRALTCVLLDIALLRSNTDDDVVVVPESCRAVGMLLEEYRYLTRSAILNFGGAPPPVVATDAMTTGGSENLQPLNP